MKDVKNEFHFFIDATLCGSWSTFSRDGKAIANTSWILNIAYIDCMNIKYCKKFCLHQQCHQHLAVEWTIKRSCQNKKLNIQIEHWLRITKAVADCISSSYSFVVDSQPDTNDERINIIICALLNFCVVNTKVITQKGRREI